MVKSVIYNPGGFAVKEILPLKSSPMFMQQLHDISLEDLAAHRQGYRATQPFPIWRVGSPYNPGPNCS